MVTSPTLQAIRAIRKGLPYKEFQKIASRLGISEDYLRDVLGFSAATTHRRKLAGQFSSQESNRLYWLSSLLDTADRVLEDSDETKVWMTTGNLALVGESPLEYAKTAPGLEAVRRLLHQLDHGVIV